MSRQQITYEDLAWDTGVLLNTIKAWRNDNTPGLSTMAACLGALGWRLAPVPDPDTLPDALREDLESVAMKHAVELPCLSFIAAFLALAPQTKAPSAPCRSMTSNDTNDNRSAAHP